MAKRSSYGDLVKIEKHPHFYLNPISKKIYYRKSINGRPVKISTGKTSIAEAKKVVDDKLIDMFSSNPAREKREKKGIKNALLRDIWKELIEDKSPQRHIHTVQGYNKEWTHGIEEFWGDKTAADINDDNCRKFENWYLKEKGTRTFFNTHKYLTMLFRYCEKQGYIKPPRPIVNDLDLVIRTKTKKEKVGRVYTPDEINAMLLTSATIPSVQLAILLGRFIGMRKMEVLTLEWTNFNLTAGTLKIWSMKNKKWRTVSLPSWLLEKVIAYSEICPSKKYVFPAAEIPSNIPSQQFDILWKEVQARAGIEGYDVKNAARFHDLRHTCATQTALEGWPVAKACEMLDMSMNEYQRTYVHVNAADLKELIEKTMKRPGVL